MPATYIDEASWDAILKPLLPILLNKLGIVSSFPRHLLFSSTKYQGIGLHHPFFWQFIIHLEPLFSETMQASKLGDKLNIMAEEIRREAALPSSLGDIPP